MSVLCRHRATRNRDQIAAIYPFARFAEAAGRLARLTRPGGYLVIYNSNYRFSDLPEAAGFVAVPLPDAGDAMGARTRLFDPEGRVLPDQTRPPAVYRKVAATGTGG
jgi:hypothetical protein